MNNSTSEAGQQITSEEDRPSTAAAEGRMSIGASISSATCQRAQDDLADLGGQQQPAVEVLDELEEFRACHRRQQRAGIGIGIAHLTAPHAGRRREHHAGRGAGFRSEGEGGDAPGRFGLTQFVQQLQYI